MGIFQKWMQREHHKSKLDTTKGEYKKAHKEWSDPDSK